MCADGDHPLNRDFTVLCVHFCRLILLWYLVPDDRHPDFRAPRDFKAVSRHRLQQHLAGELRHWSHRPRGIGLRDHVCDHRAVLRHRASAAALLGEKVPLVGLGRRRGSLQHTKVLWAGEKGKKSKVFWCISFRPWPKYKFFQQWDKNTKYIYSAISMEMKIWFIKM